MNPRVSIIIPAYNKSKLTVETVHSVLGQTYPNIEVLVVDDGSTDSTAKDLAVFGDRIRYVYKKNGGACSARNVGIKFSRGEFIGFLDCDDLYLPEKVEEGVEYLTRRPDFGFVHTAAYFINDQGKVVGTYSHPQSRHQGWIAKRLISGNYICNSTVLVRKSCLEKVGFFDETFFTPADWDLWLRLAERYKAGYMDRPLTKYRVTGNYIFNRLEESQKEELAMLDKYLERNPHVGSYVRNRFLSDLHLRYAYCYFLKNNPSKLKEEFSLSLRNNPFNFKALFVFGYYLCARESLKSRLQRKILRHVV